MVKPIWDVKRLQIITIPDIKQLKLCEEGKDLRESQLSCIYKEVREEQPLFVISSPNDNSTGVVERLPNILMHLGKDLRESPFRQTSVGE